MSVSGPLLSVDLTASYQNRAGVLRDLRFDIEVGEILGLVGQSGSGKSTAALAILRLLGLKGGTVSGTIRFAGRDLMALREREMRTIRGKEIALVLQSPASSLNPVLTVGTHLREAWRAHAGGLSWSAETDLFLQALDSVNLPAEKEFLGRYPSQISIGQAQRVLIAAAVLHHPRLLIADEPTSALDPVTQSEILELFSRLSRSLNMSILYISHDLLSVASLCARVAILESGQLVECGETWRVFRSPEHPYTRRLIDAIPKIPDAALR